MYVHTYKTSLSLVQKYCLGYIKNILPIATEDFFFYLFILTESHRSPFFSIRHPLPILHSSPQRQAVAHERFKKLCNKPLLVQQAQVIHSCIQQSNLPGKTIQLLQLSDRQRSCMYHPNLLLQKWKSDNLGTAGQLNFCQLFDPDSKLFNGSSRLLIHSNYVLVINC